MDSERNQDASIELEPRETEILVKRFELSSRLSDQLRRGNSDTLAVSLTADEANSLREQAEEILQFEGFDEDYKPTLIGEILEGLIDKLLVE